MCFMIVPALFMMLGFVLLSVVVNVFFFLSLAVVCCVVM